MPPLEDRPVRGDVQKTLADLDRRMVRLEEQRQYQTRFLEDRLGPGGVSDRSHGEIWKKLNQAIDEIYGDDQGIGLKERINAIEREFEELDQRRKQSRREALAIWTCIVALVGAVAVPLIIHGFKDDEPVGPHFKVELLEPGKPIPPR